MGQYARSSERVKRDSSGLASEKWIRAELYIGGPSANSYFHLLKEQQEEIEKTLGCQIDWEEPPDEADSRMSINLQGVNPSDLKDWPPQHAWLAERLNAMHQVLAPRVRALDANQWKPHG